MKDLIKILEVISLTILCMILIVVLMLVSMYWPGLVLKICTIALCLILVATSIMWLVTFIDKRLKINDSKDKDEEE